MSWCRSTYVTSVCRHAAFVAAASPARVTRASSFMAFSVIWSNATLSGASTSIRLQGNEVCGNIHSEDVASFMYEFFQSPRIEEVYNLGGSNSCSILEAKVGITGLKMRSVYVDQNRRGDHLLLQRPAKDD